MSTGFPTEAASGSLPMSLPRTSLPRLVSLSPSLSLRSVASIPGPPALVTIATPSPLGRGCSVKAMA